MLVHCGFSKMVKDPLSHCPTVSLADDQSLYAAVYASFTITPIQSLYIHGQEQLVMQQPIPQVDRFNQQLQTALRQATRQSPAINVTKGANLYSLGDQDSVVYLIDSGQVKLVMLSQLKNA